jgi:DNA-binding phage protein
MVRTTRFDPAEHLTDPQDQAELLNDALASGDKAYIDHALNVITRARRLREDGAADTRATFSLQSAFEKQQPLMRAA